MIPHEELYILTIHFEPPNRGQPLYKGQDVRSQGVSTVYVYIYLFNNMYLFNTVNVEIFTWLLFRETRPSYHQENVCK